MNDLQNLLKFEDSLPYLFVGSGFSRRYLGTPDWLGLLKYFSDILHPDDAQSYFKKIQLIAHQNLKRNGRNIDSVNDLNCNIADIIEDEFNLAWYTLPQFEESRNQHMDLVSQENTPFKIELSNYFNNALKQPRLLQNELEKLKLISSNSIAGIITTNYDGLIEEYFNFKKYTNQEELLFSTTQELCEIYKIHGCSSDPKTIIINSDDYSHIATKRKYLAAKLLTIFVEHPIIFIGYSIADEDITTILEDIVDCLNAAQLELLKSRLIFVDRCPDTVTADYQIEEMSIVINSKAIPMKKILLKDYGLLYELLSQNKSKYPVRILRELKENIYDLVTTNDPCDKLKIMLPLDQLDNYNDVEFVIGVGISKLVEAAYSSFSAEDIYKDIIFDNKKFDPDLLLEKTMYDHLSRTSGSMPLFKYIAGAKNKIPERIKRYIKNDYEDFYNTNIRKYRSTTYGNSINEIRKKFTYPQNLYYIIRLPYENLEKEALGEYLKSVLTDHPEDICSGTNHPYSSDLRRLIKIYDWICYSEQYQNKIASL